MFNVESRSRRRRDSHFLRQQDILLEPVAEPIKPNPSFTLSSHKPPKRKFTEKDPEPVDTSPEIDDLDFRFSMRSWRKSRRPSDVGLPAAADDEEQPTGSRVGVEEEQPKTSRAGESPKSKAGEDESKSPRSKIDDQPKDSRSKLEGDRPKSSRGRVDDQPKSARGKVEDQPKSLREDVPDSEEAPIVETDAILPEGDVIVVATPPMSSKSRRSVSAHPLPPPLSNRTVLGLSKF